MASISEVGRHSQQINLRAPEDIHQRLKEAAVRNGRSVNAEILHRIEASFGPSSELSPIVAKAIESHIENEIAARLKAIAARIGGA
jgi:plasmid stability protein